jgi:hypothetical protein
MRHDAVSMIKPTANGFCIYLKDGFEWPEPHKNARWLWFCKWTGAYEALRHTKATVDLETSPNSRWYVIEGSDRPDRYPLP